MMKLPVHLKVENKNNHPKHNITEEIKSLMQKWQIKIYIKIQITGRFVL